MTPDPMATAREDELHPAGGSSVYFSLHVNGKEIQRSTGLSDRKQAEMYACEVVRLVAEYRRGGR